VNTDPHPLHTLVAAPDGYPEWASEG